VDEIAHILETELQPPQSAHSPPRGSDPVTEGGHFETESTPVPTDLCRLSSENPVETLSITVSSPSDSVICEAVKVEPLETVAAPASASEPCLPPSKAITSPTSSEVVIFRSADEAVVRSEASAVQTRRLKSEPVNFNTPSEVAASSAASVAVTAAMLSGVGTNQGLSVAVTFSTASEAKTSCVVLQSTTCSPAVSPVTGQFTSKAVSSDESEMVTCSASEGLICPSSSEAVTPAAASDGLICPSLSEAVALAAASEGLICPSSSETVTPAAASDGLICPSPSKAVTNTASLEGLVCPLSSEAVTDVSSQTLTSLTPSETVISQSPTKTLISPAQSEDLSCHTLPQATNDTHPELILEPPDTSPVAVKKEPSMPYDPVDKLEVTETVVALCGPCTKPSDALPELSASDTDIALRDEQVELCTMSFDATAPSMVKLELPETDKNYSLTLELPEADAPLMDVTPSVPCTWSSSAIDSSPVVSTPVKTEEPSESQDCNDSGRNFQVTETVCEAVAAKPELLWMQSETSMIQSETSTAEEQSSTDLSVGAKCEAVQLDQLMPLLEPETSTAEELSNTTSDVGVTCESGLSIGVKCEAVQLDQLMPLLESETSTAEAQSSSDLGVTCESGTSTAEEKSSPDLVGAKCEADLGVGVKCEAIQLDRLMPLLESETSTAEAQSSSDLVGATCEAGTSTAEEQNSSDLAGTTCEAGTSTAEEHSSSDLVGATCEAGTSTAEEQNSSDLVGVTCEAGTSTAEAQSSASSDVGTTCEAGLGVGVKCEAIQLDQLMPLLQRGDLAVIAVISRSSVASMATILTAVHNTMTSVSSCLATSTSTAMILDSSSVTSTMTTISNSRESATVLPDAVTTLPNTTARVPGIPAALSITENSAISVSRIAASLSSPSMSVSCAVTSVSTTVTYMSKAMSSVPTMMTSTLTVSSSVSSVAGIMSSVSGTVGSSRDIPKSVTSSVISWSPNIVIPAPESTTVISPFGTTIKPVPFTVMSTPKTMMPLSSSVPLLSNNKTFVSVTEVCDLPASVAQILASSGCITTAVPRVLSSPSTKMVGLKSLVASRHPTDDKIPFLSEYPVTSCLSAVTAACGSNSAVSLIDESMSEDELHIVLHDDSFVDSEQTSDNKLEPSVPKESSPAVCGHPADDALPNTKSLLVTDNENGSVELDSSMKTRSSMSAHNSAAANSSLGVSKPRESSSAVCDRKTDDVLSNGKSLLVIDNGKGSHQGSVCSGNGSVVLDSSMKTCSTMSPHNSVAANSSIEVSKPRESSPAVYAHPAGDVLPDGKSLLVIDTGKGSRQSYVCSGNGIILDSSTKTSSLTLTHNSAAANSRPAVSSESKRSPVSIADISSADLIPCVADILAEVSLFRPLSPIPNCDWHCDLCNGVSNVSQVIVLRKRTIRKRKLSETSNDDAILPAKISASSSQVCVSTF